MKQPLLFLFFLFVLSFSQQATAQADPGLQARLAEYVQLNRALEFEKLMDYIYPKLFTVAPKEQMMAVMKSMFEGDDDIEMKMDSLATGKVFVPVTWEGGQYTKIQYSMLLRMIMKPVGEKTTADTLMLNLLKSQYGMGNVWFDPATSSYLIRVVSSMIAIKDEQSPEWTFLNFKPGDAIIQKLLNKEVIEKLNSLN